MIELPDLDEERRKADTWLTHLRALWPLLFTTFAGVALAVGGALHVKADALHYVLGVPATFTIVDSPPLWLVLAAVGLGIGVLSGSHAVITRHQRRKERREFALERQPFELWQARALEDRLLEAEKIFVTALDLRISGSSILVDMTVDNRNAEPIRIIGVCVNWVQNSAAEQVVPSGLCVLSAGRAEFAGSTQVAATFELTRDIAEYRGAAHAHVSFGFTRHGVEWKRWAKPVAGVLHI